MAQPNYDFRGKKALVTGGSRGIGRDIVAGLAKANIDKIYVIARTQTTLDAVKAEFPCVETINVDLGNWTQTKQALENIEPVNYLINNASVWESQSLFDTTEELLDSILNVNLKSVINVSKIVCKKMLEIGGGVVVNMSGKASPPTPTFMAYSASKAALDQVTRHMAFELGPKIRVNAVNPTLVLTDVVKALLHDSEEICAMANAIKARIALQRYAELEEVTAPVLFLLSDGAAMINGQCLSVCGGYE